MQFGEDEAVFYEPGSGSTWLTTSAEQVLRTHSRLGDARLAWLAD